MALVTIQRSPSSSTSPNQDENTGFDEVDTNRNPKSLSECCYVAGKATALELPDAHASAHHLGAAGKRTNGGAASSAEDETTAQNGECAGQGAGGPVSATATGSSSTIQKHLQSMFYLLRPEETLKMAVKLESTHPTRTRYLVVVSRMGVRGEESCLLGIDCNERTTVGLVLKVLANTTITLDGDGGFSVSVCDRHHIFKPVSVQAMWSALQTLHKVSAKARDLNYFQPQPGGAATHHAWVDYYKVTSDQSCLNEWYAMDNLESRRPPSPDSLRNKPTKREETEQVIRSALKEIMMSVDLDEVTAKMIRSQLEENLDMDLGEYKSFIDEEMLVILGQMDAPTEIFDHVYLGSEWNASNYDELKKNGVGHILNVTMEIDNFFPGTFDYLNVRVYDDEKTDLLKHWDDTFKYITKAKQQGSKVLVHCKMGVSRSASVVIAYAMKAYSWDFNKALTHVKDKRSCIKPNSHFIDQLETYQGILKAAKNREKLQRSKSETNLKSPTNSSKSEKVPPGGEPTPVTQALSKSYDLHSTLSGGDLRNMGSRPKSWSPDNLETRELRNSMKTSPNFVSLEDLSQKSASKESIQECKKSLARHVLMPCDNGESYSVSPNQIVHLPGHDLHEDSHSRERQPTPVYSKKESRKVSSIVSRFGEASHKNQESSFSVRESEKRVATSDTWDPGERDNNNRQFKVVECVNQNLNICDQKPSIVTPTMWTSSSIVVKTESAVHKLSDNNTSNSQICSVPTESQQSKSQPVPGNVLKHNSAQASVTKSNTTAQVADPFSNQLDRVFDREEKKQHRLSASQILPASTDQPDKVPRDSPSRQSSWSSYDSACAMGFQEKEPQSGTELSRHSSWGSGDTRALPSRNSSWGSYDIRPPRDVYYNNEHGEKILHSTTDLEHSSSGIFPYNKEEIPWHPGTVKRTKQRIEGAGNGTTGGASNNLTGSGNTSRPLSSGENSMTSSCLSLTKTPSQEALPVNFAQAVNETVVERAKTTTEEFSSAISDRINIPIEERIGSSNSRLSLSAPEPSAMELISTDSSLSRSALNVSDKEMIPAQAQKSVVKQQKSFLESLQQQKEIKAQKQQLKTQNKVVEDVAGIVKSLKKEFEAKSNTSTNIFEQTIAEDANLKVPKSRGSSLPNSPVSVHQAKEPPPQKSNDDMSVKGLKSMFEHPTEKPVKLRERSSAQKRANRFSCIELTEKCPKILQTPLITNLSRAETAENEQFRRPPKVPAVRGIDIAQTVISVAAKKNQQQYGKSHPLAKLTINPRHKNPVYNTM